MPQVIRVLIMLSLISLLGCTVASTTMQQIDTTEPTEQAEVEVTTEGDTVDSDQDNARIQLFENENDLIGVWQNLDQDTRSIPQIHIFKNDGQFMVHAWGSCHPDWCDWATQEGNINNTELNVLWDFGFATEVMSLTLQTEDLLQLKMQTYFTDDSGRADFDTEEVFSRMQEPVATVTPVVRVTPEFEFFGTDCISYDPTALEIVDEASSGWLLTDGGSRMIMLDNENDARTALAIVSRHNKQCFIGRDNNREDRRSYIVEYWLGDSGIETTVSDEDCLPYNPNDLEIVDEGVSGWLLTDGHSRMLMLDNEKDATHAFNTATSYTTHCFIGRDNKKSDRSLYIMEYWR